MSRSPPSKRVGVYVTLLSVLSVVFIGLADVGSWSIGVQLSGPTQHILAFGVLAVIVGCAFPGRSLIACISLTALGGLIEVIQPFFGRAFEWSDIAMNALGAVVGTMLATLILQLFRARRHNRRPRHKV